MFEITHLLARTVWTYLRAPLPVSISKGAIDVRGNYEISTSGGPLGLQLNVQQTVLTDLGLAPKAGSADYIDLARLEVLDTKVDLAKRAVNIGKVRLQRGEIRSWLDAQGRLNLLDFQPSPTDAAPAAPAPAASAPEAAAQASAAPVSGAAGSATSTSAALAPAPPAAVSPPPVTSNPTAPETRAPSAAPAPAPAPATWTVAVPDIAAEDLKVSMEDRQVTPAVRSSSLP